MQVSFLFKTTSMNSVNERFRSMTKPKYLSDSRSKGAITSFGDLFFLKKGRHSVFAVDNVCTLMKINTAVRLFCQFLKWFRTARQRCNLVLCPSHPIAGVVLFLTGSSSAHLLNSADWSLSPLRQRNPLRRVLWFGSSTRIVELLGRNRGKMGTKECVEICFGGGCF